MPKIIPIKDLKNTSQISEMCHVSEEPIYISKNGYGDMVIMSVELYEMTMKRLNMYHQLELSENQIDTGKTRDARESLDNLKKNGNITSL
jgi:PHD/YefM family antitoxin component YafN of YafNO toxin-antitoxin module